MLGEIAVSQPEAVAEVEPHRRVDVVGAVPASGALGDIGPKERVVDRVGDAVLGHDAAAAFHEGPPRCGVGPSVSGPAAGDRERHDAPVGDAAVDVHEVVTLVQERGQVGAAAAAHQDVLLDAGPLVADVALIAMRIEPT